MGKRSSHKSRVWREQREQKRSVTAELLSEMARKSARSSCDQCGSERIEWMTLAEAAEVDSRAEEMRGKLDDSAHAWRCTACGKGLGVFGDTEIDPALLDRFSDLVPHTSDHGDEETA